MGQDSNKISYSNNSFKKNNSIERKADNAKIINKSLKAPAQTNKQTNKQTKVG